MTDRLEEAQLETSITAEEAAQALVKLAAHRPKDAEEVLTELIANVYIASGLHSLLAWSSAEDRVNRAANLSKTAARAYRGESA
jgi:hypothetical protein